MKNALLVTFAVFALFGAGASRAQIPVTDVLSLAQQIQQVLAWGQQYTQMVETLQNQAAQIQQLQSTYDSMTGTRGLGNLLNAAAQQGARRYLPGEMDQIYSLYEGNILPGYAALVARINALRDLISALPPDYFPAGSQADAELRRLKTILATQRTMAEAAYRASTQRVPDVESLLTAIDGANDPKAIGELQARIAGEQVLATNEQTRIHLMLYQQALDRDERDRRAVEKFSEAQRAEIPTALFPGAAF